MSKKLKVAAVQMAAGPDPAANVTTAVSLTRRAVSKGAEFIVLPETFYFRGDMRRAVSLAERIPGESLRPFIAIAKKNKVWILAGSVSEKIPGSPKSYNTSVIINPLGQITARYRKMNLFESALKGAVMTESRRTLRGKKPVLANVAGFMTGLSICFDLRFPELYRYYWRKGAMMLCVPSSFTSRTGRDHWKALIRARAIENQCFVIAPNQYGQGSGGIDTYGHSLIVGPWGEILKEGPAGHDAVLIADLDFEEARKIRGRMKIRR